MRRPPPTPHPGRVVVHRLNRTEYTNAIRDLLALDVDGRALLPADEPDQQGFDNVAGVLSVSPRLLENYMTAANTISRLAIGDAHDHPGRGHGSHSHGDSRRTIARATNCRSDRAAASRSRITSRSTATTASRWS